MKMTTFRDHVVIVTGATSGTGKVLSFQLAKEFLISNGHTNFI